MSKFTILIISFFMTNCMNSNNSKSEEIVFKGNKYKMKSYLVFDLKGSHIESNYFAIRNDSIFIIDYNDFCPKVWCLGILNSSVKETLSLNNECGLSSEIKNLQSKLIFVDTIEEEKIYNFKINQGDNMSLSNTERLMTFSEKTGIVCLLKRDTIFESPFW